jgi:helix-turn-helix protein
LSFDPIVARKTWRTLEPVHAMIYFAPEAHESYRAVGLTGDRMGYFASRSAALGAVPADVVIATFFNFCPSLVRAAIPAAWALASPPQILEARVAAADRALRRALGKAVASDVVTEASTLSRRAALVACEHLEARPLFAAHAALEWPGDAHLVLWHAQTLLREFRGDAHLAALLLDGLSGVEALIIHAATGDIPASVLQASRAWPDLEWTAAVERLRGRGLLATDGTLALSDEGRRRRQWVEDRTDALAVVAYDALGEDGCARLREIGRPLSQAVIDAGLIPVR